MLAREKIIALILGHATADALGVPVEFTRRSKLKNNPVTKMLSFGTYNQPAGTWSDDTSLTIAALESIARLKKNDYADILKNFYDWYNYGKFTAGDKTFDCGNTTFTAIANFASGTPPLECGPRNEHAAGNGSLMRISPVAMYIYQTRGNNFDAATFELVHNFSSITHGNKNCLIACGIYCLVAAEIFDGQNLSAAISNGLTCAKNFYGKLREFELELKNFARLFDANFDKISEDEIKSSGYVVHSLEAALWCLLNTENYRDAVLKAVNLGGDTDTIGAIAGGLAGTFYGLEEIPAEWLDVLKKKIYLEKIAEDFYNAFN